MSKAEVLTPWTGTGNGTEDANRPLLAEDHSLQKWEDITAQDAANLQPDPNLYSIKIECDPAVLTAIESDATYFVVWSEA